AVSKFDSLWTIFEQIQKRFQPIYGLRRVPEARRKLKQNTTELVRLEQGQDAFFELVHLFNRPLTFLVSELLPRFDSELEVFRRTLCPTFGSLGSARPIESRIDFDCIEISRIELQLIGLRQRIEETRPRARTTARWITPAAGSDAPRACIILRFDEKVVC